MQTKLDHMKTFVAVVEAGSLNEAAKILNRTPSAISMTLKQFTESLGNELFETDRKSSLTPFGYFVLEQSRDALKHFEDSMQTIHRYARGNYGTVRVAAVPSFSTRSLPAIVKQFNRYSSDVHLEIRDMDSALINKAVQNGDIDFGIASKIGMSNQIQAELILQEPFGVVCRSACELAKRKSISWGLLDSEEFIANNLVKLIDHPAVRQLVQKSTLHIHNVASLLSFINEGFGVTILPRSAVPDNQNLAFIPLSDNSMQRQLFILKHRKHRLNPAANKFREFILQQAGL